MTLYQITVRASSEQYNMQAHQVAREILQLPWNYLPSLAAISASTSPLSILTTQLYYLTGQLTSTQINQLTRQLLIDPVMQKSKISQKSDNSSTAHIVDIFFHQGVTDTLAESVLPGASKLGITTLEHVETGRRYILDERLNEDEVRYITGALLYNPVIQNYVLHDTVGARFIALDSLSSSATSEGAIYRTPKYIPLSDMTDQQLLELSKKGLLALNLDEMRTIRQHYKEQQREPTDVELETLAQTWSEHCSRKTFKTTIHYQELDSKGKLLEQETINGLLKQYIMRATQHINRPWVVSAFSDNAGIVRFTETQDIALSPSQAVSRELYPNSDMRQQKKSNWLTIAAKIWIVEGMI